MSPLIVIHVARKPLKGTVAGNALKYSTGSLNINGTRLGAAPDSTGRWPANVILQHQGCKLVGQHHESFPISVYDAESLSGNFTFYIEGDGKHQGYKTKVASQIVEDWDCTDECPIAEISKQSGVLTSGKAASGGHRRNSDKYRNVYSPFAGEVVEASALYGDSGSAARYFKQVSNEQDLIDYLEVMISTPDQKPRTINMASYPEDIHKWGGESIVGLIVVGKLEQEHAAEFMRVLMPGSHILRIAPEHQPTGHSGAIVMEDAGFEIRDAIVLVRKPGQFHYVAKAGRKEREAGCANLPEKKGHEAVDRKEGSAGVGNPRAGAGRTADSVRNHHPTVKPVLIMERLLADVPVNAVVLDPFMGSGSTGIACVKTGHSFIGIEQEPGYLEIADARVQYWDQTHVGWQAAKIVSDHKAEEPVVKVVSLNDLFD